MRPFSKWTAVRTPLTSRLSRISLRHCAVDEAPPTVRGIEGSFKLSKTAVRKEFRNCSLTVTVASAAGISEARRVRVAADSWASAPAPVPIRNIRIKPRTSEKRSLEGGWPPLVFNSFNIGYILLDQKGRGIASTTSNLAEAERQSLYALCSGTAATTITTQCAQYRASGSDPCTFHCHQHRAPA